MKDSARSRKSWLLPLAAVSAAVWAAAWLAPGFFGPYLEERLVEAAEDRGARLEIRDPEYGWASARASSLDLEITSGKLFFNGSFQRVNLRWSPLSPLNPTFDLSGEFCGGRVQASFSCTVRNRKGQGLLRLKNVDLSKHPQLKTFGVGAGVLNLDIPSLSVDGGGIVRGEGSIEVFDVERHSAAIDRLIPVKLPEIKEGRLSSDFTVGREGLSIRRFESSSNLGTVNGSGSFGPASIAFRADVALTQEGLAAVGPYLPLISNNRLRSDQGIFRVSVNGPTRRPSWQVTGP